MTCSACGADAPVAARFCLQCGSALTATCPSCGTELPGGARFCSACGTRLDEAPDHPGSVHTEERKLISVLFADLVGFTSHTESADPEDVRERLTAYHARVRQDVERFGGRVEKLMGDGVFAVFGVPAAHEDDAERAVRSALRIQESVDQLNADNLDLALSVRIGVTTGEAIVQLDDHPDREGIIGDVVNTASRLEGVAEPGTVVVDERTHRGAEAAIEFGDPHIVTVKGKSEPMRVWQAIAPRSRLGVLEEEHATPFVGRDAELDLLVSTFERTLREGSIQLVTITGEPGVGKSRLLFEFRSAVDDRPDLVFWRQGRCLPYGEGITFWALGEIIKAQAGIDDSDPRASVVTKLGQAVDQLIEDPVAASWVRSRLADVVGAGETPGEVEAQELFAALTRFFEALAARNPLVLVIEDLQWADSGLLGFLDHLTGWATDSPILVVGTARPELLTAHPEWGGGKRNATTLGLSPLSDDDTARIVASLLDRALVDAGVQRTILEKCGGNPLYATEFVRYATERGLLDDLSSISDLAIPDTIHGVIAARLDLLGGDEKRTLQAASVIGRLFWSDAVASVTGRRADEVRRILRELATRELIRPVRQTAAGGHEEWTFTHALVTDVAYRQLSRNERGGLHLSVTRWVENAAAERLGEVSEVLAHHYGQVFDLTPALANDDVRGRAYEVCMTAAERVVAFDATRGGSFYQRAISLARSPAERARALLDRGDHFAAYDDIDSAERDSLAAVDDARLAGDVELEAEALLAVSGNHWYRGDAAGRTRHIDAAAALLEGRPASEIGARVIATRAFDAWVGGDSAAALDILEQGRDVLTVASPETRGLALNVEGGARITLGDESGLEMMRQSLDIALDRNQTFRANAAYNNLATHAVFHWPAPEVTALIEQAIAMCEERGYVAHSEWSRMTRVESLFPAGRWDEAKREIEDVIASDKARGGSRVAPDAQGWLALLTCLGGEPEQARVLFDEVIDDLMESADLQYRAGALATGVLVAGATGDHESVRAYADRLEATLADSVGYADLFAGLVAESLVDAGREDQLARLIRMARSNSPWGTARRRLAEAVVAGASGDHDQAVALAGEATEMCEALDHVFDPIRSRIVAARSLIALDRSDEAAALLDRAIADGERIGAALLVAEARQLLDRGTETEAAVAP